MTQDLDRPHRPLPDYPRSAPARRAAIRRTSALPPDPPGFGEIVFAASSRSGEPFRAADSFVHGERISWHARFAMPPRSARIAVLAIHAADDGWEDVASAHELWITHPMAPGFTGWFGPGTYDEPGRYILRIIVADQVLAEGRFEIVPSASADDPIH